MHPRWLNRGVAGIGAASFLDDVGKEISTSLLPAFLTSTLGAPAAALGAFLAAYVGFALTGSAIILFAALFAAAGIGIGFETAQHAAVAALAPPDLRGSAFGALAAIQSFGNLAASAVAGGLWTLVSPRAAFLYLAGWMVVSAAALVAMAGRLRLLP